MNPIEALTHRSEADIELLDSIAQPHIHVLDTVLDSIEPRLHPTQPGINLLETGINLLETGINLLETGINLLETGINLLEVDINLFEAKCDITASRDLRPVERRHALEYGIGDLGLEIVIDEPLTKSQAGFLIGCHGSSQWSGWEGK